jgi:hypothetical protein
MAVLLVVLCQAAQQAIEIIAALVQDAAAALIFLSAVVCGRFRVSLILKCGAD